MTILNVGEDGATIVHLLTPLSNDTQIFRCPSRSDQGQEISSYRYYNFRDMLSTNGLCCDYSLTEIWVKKHQWGSLNYSEREEETSIETAEAKAVLFKCDIPDERAKENTVQNKEDFVEHKENDDHSKCHSFHDKQDFTNLETLNVEVKAAGDVPRPKLGIPFEKVLLLEDNILFNTNKYFLSENLSPQNWCRFCQGLIQAKLFGDVFPITLKNVFLAVAVTIKDRQLLARFENHTFTHNQERIAMKTQFFKAPQKYKELAWEWNKDRFIDRGYHHGQSSPFEYCNDLEIADEHEIFKIKKSEKEKKIQSSFLLKSNIRNAYIHADQINIYGGKVLRKNFHCITDVIEFLIAGNHSSVEGWDNIAINLMSGPRLKALVIRRNQIKEEKTDVSANLSYLIIAGNKISEEGFTNTVKYLRSVQKLREIYNRGHQIRQQSIKELNKSWKYLDVIDKLFSAPKLKRLDIGGNQIREIGAVIGGSDLEYIEDLEDIAIVNVLLNTNQIIDIGKHVLQTSTHPLNQCRFCQVSIEASCSCDEFQTHFLAVAKCKEYGINLVHGILWSNSCSEHGLFKIPFQNFDLLFVDCNQVELKDIDASTYWPYLEELNILGNEIPNEGFTDNCRELSSVLIFRKLDVGEISLRNNGARMLSDLFSPKLEEPIFAEAQIKCIGLLKNRDSVPNLRKLYIKGNQIRDCGAAVWGSVLLDTNQIIDTGKHIPRANTNPLNECGFSQGLIEAICSWGVFPSIYLTVAKCKVYSVHGILWSNSCNEHGLFKTSLELLSEYCNQVELKDIDVSTYQAGQLLARFKHYSFEQCQRISKYLRHYNQVWGCLPIDINIGKGHRWFITHLGRKDETSNREIEANALTFQSHRNDNKDDFFNDIAEEDVLEHKEGYTQHGNTAIEGISVKDMQDNSDLGTPEVNVGAEVIPFQIKKDHIVNSTARESIYQIGISNDGQTFQDKKYYTDFETKNEATELESKTVHYSLAEGGQFLNQEVHYDFTEIAGKIVVPKECTKVDSHSFLDNQKLDDSETPKAANRIEDALLLNTKSEGVTFPNQVIDGGNIDQMYANIASLPCSDQQGNIGLESLDHPTRGYRPNLKTQNDCDTLLIDDESLGPDGGSDNKNEEEECSIPAAISRTQTNHTEPRDHAEKLNEIQNNSLEGVSSSAETDRETRELEDYSGQGESEAHVSECRDGIVSREDNSHALHLENTKKIREIEDSKRQGDTETEVSGFRDEITTREDHFRALQLETTEESEGSMGHGDDEVNGFQNVDEMITTDENVNASDTLSEAEDSTRQELCETTVHNDSSKLTDFEIMNETTDAEGKVIHTMLAEGGQFPKQKVGHDFTDIDGNIFEPKICITIESHSFPKNQSVTDSETSEEANKGKDSSLLKKEDITIQNQVDGDDNIDQQYDNIASLDFTDLQENIGLETPDQTTRRKRPNSKHLMNFRATLIDDENLGLDGCSDNKSEREGCGIQVAISRTLTNHSELRDQAEMLNEIHDDSLEGNTNAATDETRELEDSSGQGESEAHISECRNEIIPREDNSHAWHLENTKEIREIEDSKRKRNTETDVSEYRDEILPREDDSHALYLETTEEIREFEDSNRLGDTVKNVSEYREDITPNNGNSHALHLVTTEETEGSMEHGNDEVNVFQNADEVITTDEIVNASDTLSEAEISTRQEVCDTTVNHNDTSEQRWLQMLNVFYINSDTDLIEELNMLYEEIFLSTGIQHVLKHDDDLRRSCTRESWKRYLNFRKTIHLLDRFVYQGYEMKPDTFPHAVCKRALFKISLICIRMMMIFLALEMAQEDTTQLKNKGRNTIQQLTNAMLDLWGLKISETFGKHAFTFEREMLMELGYALPRAGEKILKNCLCSAAELRQLQLQNGNVHVEGTEEMLVDVTDGTDDSAAVVLGQSLDHFVNGIIVHLDNDLETVLVTVATQVNMSETPARIDRFFREVGQCFQELKCNINHLAEESWKAYDVQGDTFPLPECHEILLEVGKETLQISLLSVGKQLFHPLTPDRVVEVESSVSAMRDFIQRYRDLLHPPGNSYQLSHTIRDNIVQLGRDPLPHVRVESSTNDNTEAVSRSLGEDPNLQLETNNVASVREASIH